MPTTVTKSIGTSSRDYSTIQAWEDASPADLTAVDQIWKGECYNDSEFLGSGTTMLTVAGTTTDATRYLWLTAASGQSFRDDAGAATNAQKYDQSKGVGVRVTGSYSILLSARSSAPNLLIERLQFYYDTTYGSNYYIAVQGSANATFKNCIFQSRRNAGIAHIVGTYINCAVLFVGSTSSTGALCGGEWYNCTVALASDVTNTGSVGFNSLNYSGYPLVKNCAVFGFATAFGGTLGSYIAGTSYNASDASTGNMPGSNNVGSLTYASQFEGTTSAAPDFRAKSGGGLQAGAPDTTNTGGVDIIGTARSGTTPTIGAWELAAAAAAASLIADIRRRANFGALLQL